jgi:clavulanate-9-aldehyde reductase
MIQVNLLAVIAASKAAIPHLERSGRGQIINLGSMSGRRVGSADTGVYAATKHAVHALGQALRLELHGRGVRVSTIAPGYVRTGFGVPDESRRTGNPSPEEDVRGLKVRDVVAQIIQVLKAPVDVSITEIAMVSVEQDPW